MNRIRSGNTINFNRMVAVLVAMIIGFPMAPGLVTAARANGGAAFLGGMVAAHVVGGAVRRDRVRTAAAVETANNSQRQQAAPAPAAAQTQEQKLRRVNNVSATTAMAM